MKITSKILTALSISKRVSELLLNPSFVTEIHNWPRFLADFIYPLKEPFVIHLKRGGKLTLRGDTFDKWPVSEIIVRDDYRLRNLNPPPKTIIDLGAGIGDFCVYASLLFPEAKIYAFEPDRESYHLLTSNIKLNSLQKFINTYKLAVTNKNTGRKQYMNGTKGFPYLVSRYPKDQLLQTTTLKEIFSHNKITACDLLKIDIEGAEYAVLYSLPDALYKRIKRIHLECHNFREHKFTDMGIKQFLEIKGFMVEERKHLDQSICMLYGVNRINF